MRPTGYLLNTAQLYYNEHWALPRNTTLLSLYSPLHQIYFSNKIHHHQPSSYINTIYNLCIKIFSLFSDCYVSAQDYARVHNKLLDPSLFLYCGKENIAIIYDSFIDFYQQKIVLFLSRKVSGPFFTLLLSPEA